MNDGSLNTIRKYIEFNAKENPHSDFVTCSHTNHKISNIQLKINLDKTNFYLVNKKKTDLSEKNITFKKNAKKIFDIINKKNYKFSKRTKDNNELYGSIKPRELSKTIESLDKIEIKPSQFDLDKEINKVGSYEAKINLHAEVQAKIHIEVVKQEEAN